MKVSLKFSNNFHFKSTKLAHKKKLTLIIPKQSILKNPLFHNYTNIPLIWDTYPCIYSLLITYVHIKNTPITQYRH